MTPQSPIFAPAQFVTSYASIPDGFQLVKQNISTRSEVGDSGWR